MRYFTALFIVLMAFANARGQVGYSIESSIEVDGLKYPWGGGLNSGQYSNIDLNLDGIDDVVIFDKSGSRLLTFLYENGELSYKPEYAAYFPSGLKNWVLFRDFNCDGKADMFTSDPLGMRVYVNESTKEAVKWRLFDDRTPSSSPLLTKGFTSNINLQLNASDLPAIEDVDGDGDLDILVFKPTANSTVELHINLSMERSGNCDSLQMERVTQRWGDFQECNCYSFAFADDECGAIGGREMHQGGKALFLYDGNADGKLDVVVSEETCSSLRYLQNTGTSVQANFSSFNTSFPNATNPVDIDIFPTVYKVDMDNDGVQDIIISPSFVNNDNGSIDFKHSNYYYKNTGTDAAPNYSFSSNDFLQREMIEVGENAAPAFFDVDSDGDLDMIVGSYLEEHSSAYVAQLKLYENVGSSTTPEFHLADLDYLNFSSRRLFNIKPLFYDINNDGQKDLIISATTASDFTTNIYYLLNDKGFDNSGTLKFLFNVSAAGTYGENYTLADINNDGLTDVLIGRLNGRVEYYHNVGTADFPKFSLVDESFYGLDYSTSRLNPAISFADLDGDDHLDMVVGDNSGRITVYTDVLNNLEEPLAGQSELVEINGIETLTTYQLGSRLKPVVVNLFNDQNPGIMVGNGEGGLQYLRSTGNEFNPELYSLDVYPVPVSRSVHRQITLRSDIAGQLQVVSSLGQVVYTQNVEGNKYYSINVTQLSQGYYSAVVIGGGEQRVIQKFIVIE